MSAEPLSLFDSFVSRHPISDEFRRALAVEAARLAQAARDLYEKKPGVGLAERPLSD